LLSFATFVDIAKTSVQTQLDRPNVMETNKSATAMQDSDGASDCSNFSIITPPSASSKSSCGKCCSQDKAPEKDSDVAAAVNEQDRTKNKKRRPTKSQRLQAEVSEPCIHSLTEKSENLSTRMTDVELRMWNVQFEAAAKSASANENNSSARDTIQAEIGLEKETVATLLKNQNQHLWEEVACILRQALLEHEFVSPPGTRQYLPLQDQNWCFEIVKNAFIASLVDDAKRDAATSMLATSTLASDGLPASRKKKKKAMGRSDWTEPNVIHDPFLPPQPEVYGMAPMEQHPGYLDPFAPRQPMPYPPPPNPEAYGMPPTRQYPDSADPFAHMRPMPYTPPPPPPPNPEVHVMGEFPRPPKPFAEPQSPPYSPPYSPTPSPRRAVESGASSFVDWRERPKLKSKSKSRLRINKFEVRWWMRTALSAFEIMCMMAVIIAVFRAPGLLGELVDVMNPKNKDRCLGFRVRR
jgi:hypothetical protein